MATSPNLSSLLILLLAVTLLMLSHGLRFRGSSKNNNNNNNDRHVRYYYRRPLPASGTTARQSDPFFSCKMEMYTSRPRTTWAPWQKQGQRHHTEERLYKNKRAAATLPIDTDDNRALLGNGDIASTMEITAAPTAATTAETAGPSPDRNSISADGSRQPNLAAYWALLRPHNIPASFGLVAAGALVASHSTASLLDLKVIFTGVAAAAISVGSCVLNDWFDIELDRVNKPDRPLVTGEVVPKHALAMGLGCLLLAVVSASAVHPAALQATIIASVALTSAYTPLLKPLPLVKNFVVAGVIAGAISSGGLAAGAGLAGTLAPTWLTFFVIAHREILMDITDIEGDDESGIRTLPVIMGREKSLSLASLLLTAGLGGAGYGILSHAASTMGPKASAAVLFCLFAMPMYMNILKVRRSEFSPETLSSAVEQAMGPLALMLGLMGFALR